MNQTVCAITGEYVESSVDLILPGPEPLVMYRSYSSMDSYGHLGRHWYFNHRGGSCVKRDDFGESSTFLCFIYQPSGAKLHYSRTLKSIHKKRPESISFKLKLPNGLTNCGSGKISARTNVKNQQATYFFEKEKLEVKSSSGSLLTFKQLKKDETNDPTLFQTSERKSSGNGILYSPVKEKGFTALGEIQAANLATRQVYSWAKLERGKKDKYGLLPPKVLEASDGRKIYYKYFEHAYPIKIKSGETQIETVRLDDYLTEVNSPFAPRETFEYCRKHDPHLFQICCKKLPDERFLKTEYYQVGKNHVGAEVIQIKDKHDYRIDRVKLQKAPVGTDPTPIVTHRFIYKANTKPRSHKAEEVLDGTTDVLDAYLHKTSYSYTKEHRLKSIKRYLGTKEYALYSAEKYVWGNPDTSNEGNLIGKYLVDGTDRLYSGRYFTYDENGNILIDSLYGRLSGLDTPDLLLDTQQMPIANGCECYQKSFRYSEDGLNLLLSEFESNGKATHYFYQPGTDLLTRKLIYWYNQLCQRSFYFYDQNAVLIKTVTDNGSSPDYQNLTGVTERQIVNIIPTAIMPIGLPAQTDEMYLDLVTGQEVLLKRVLATYSSEGRLLKQDIYDSQGLYRYSLNYAYDLHGNVTQETNALGEIIIKSYDENNNLVSKQGPRSDYCTKYTYDFSNRLIREEEVPVDPTKPLLVLTHRYDYLGNRIATVNPYGQETLYQYDDLGRLILTIYPQVENEAGQLIQPTEAKEYDIAGRVIAIIDAKGQRTSKAYNIRGQSTHVIYPDGTQEHWIYEINGNLAVKIEKNGTKTCYIRDYQGRVIQEDTYSSDDQLLKTSSCQYNAFHLISSTDAEGMVTSYRYDNAGRVIATIKGNQIQTQIYDTLGRVSEIREGINAEPNQVRVIKKAYDLLDRLIEERIEDLTGNLLHIRSYVYDCQGNQIQIQEGETSKYIEYNAFKQPIKMTDALGQAVHIVYDYRFINPHGQRVLCKVMTDPLGNQTIEIHDAANRLVQVLKKNPFDVDVACQRIYYDACGNQVRVVDDVMYEGKSLRQIETVWHYNVAHQVVALVEAAFAPEQKITHYLYNGYGQKAAEIHPNGTHLIYTYDLLGRLKDFQSSDRSIHYVYEYNRLDEPTKITDLIQGCTNERIYNDMGKLACEKLGNGLAITYTYDNLERIKAIGLPDQTAIEYLYNALDLKEVRRWKDDQIVYTHTDLAHNLSGQILKSELIGQAGQIQYQYDALGRQVDIRSSCTAQAIVQGGYDAAGNLRMYWDQATLYQFDYDDLYQLKSEKGGIEHTYQCDSLSNRLAKDKQPYEVNQLNQVLSETDATYAYDPNGNLIRKTKGTKVTTYAYDALNRLINVCTDGISTTYLYDSFNRRIMRKQEGTADQHFLYQGNEEIGVWENGTINELKVLGNGTKVRAIALELDQRTYVPFYDLFGHMKCVTDLKGQIVEQYSYSAFGEEEIHSADGQLRKESEIGNPWRYAGKRVDDETGFVAFGLRYYDPVIGRWITTDPIGFEDGPNLYAYLHHNPFAYFDAFGLFSEDRVWGFEAHYERDPAKHLADLDLIADSSNFPKSFWTEFSQIYDLNKDLKDPLTGKPFDFKNRPSNQCVTSMNGICNSLLEFTENMKYLGKITEFNLQGVHCATFGIVNDLIGYAGVRFLDLKPEAVFLLLDLWEKCFDALDKNAIILHYCHSRGVTYTKAALELLPPELAKRIFVVATAPGSYIPRDLCYGVVHLVCSNDLVPCADLIGRERARKEGTLVEIDVSHSKANIFKGLESHSFTNPAYEEHHRLYYKMYEAGVL